MKIQPHHIDLTQSKGKAVVSFEQRMRIQLQMIQDHAWLKHVTLEEACWSWVTEGWAALFAQHYFIKKD